MSSGRAVVCSSPGVVAVVDGKTWLLTFAAADEAIGETRVVV